ncbi:hypothetical protein ACNOYE_15625 [Nannocystaceae bacterium ST9]
MTLSSQASLAARFELVPTLRVGPLWFGSSVRDHAELLRRIEDEDVLELDEDLIEYAVEGLEDALSVHADREGRIDTVTFYGFCQLRGRDLIGMEVGELLVALGEAPDDIEADTIGGELELIYVFVGLGLLIWTQDGVVGAVQAAPAAY